MRQGANQALQETRGGEADISLLGLARLTTPIAWSKNGRTTKWLGHWPWRRVRRTSPCTIEAYGFGGVGLNASLMNRLFGGRRKVRRVEKSRDVYVLLRSSSG